MRSSSRKMSASSSLAAEGRRGRAPPPTDRCRDAGAVPAVASCLEALAVGLDPAPPGPASGPTSSPLLPLLPSLDVMSSTSVLTPYQADSEGWGKQA